MVSTNAGGLPYLIDNGKDGILIEKENPSKMVQQIRGIIEENKISLAENARLKVENFDWCVVRNQWLKLLG